MSKKKSSLKGWRDAANRQHNELVAVKKTAAAIWQVLCIAEADYAKYPAVQADLRFVARAALETISQ
jgi:hypothetical protein